MSDFMDNIACWKNRHEWALGTNNQSDPNPTCSPCTKDYVEDPPKSESERMKEYKEAFGDDFDPRQRPTDPKYQGVI